MVPDGPPIGYVGLDMVHVGLHMVPGGPAWHGRYMTPDDPHMHGPIYRSLMVWSKKSYLYNTGVRCKSDNSSISHNGPCRKVSL